MTLAEWNLVSNGNPSNVNTNINAGIFTGGEGISAVTFTADGASASSWSQDVLDATDYYQITLSPKTDYEMILSDISFGERRTLTGIRNYQVQWSKNADFTSSTTIETINVPDDDEERDKNITGLNINVGRGETIYIRLFGYNAEGSSGTWRINDGTLKVQGTVLKVIESQEIKDCKLLPNPNDDLQIEVSDINVISGFGDDNEWLPFDEVEIEITIENENNHEKIEDIVLDGGCIILKQMSGILTTRKMILI